MILTLIIFWTLLVLTFALGVYVGTKLATEVSEDIMSEVQKHIPKSIDTSPVGLVMRPTQKDIEDRANPKVQAGKQAFKELLDTIIKKDETTE